MNTDESAPQGTIILDAQAAGANQIQLKWYTNDKSPLIPNGRILFSILVKGPFLIPLNSTQVIEFLKAGKPLTEIKTHNLLNSTMMNTIYGIMDGILPNSIYNIIINASNSKGFLLSNQVKVATFASIPGKVMPPQLVSSTSNTMQIEWYNPILANSNDTLFYFQVYSKVK